MNTNEYLNEINKNLKWIEISEENFKLYVSKLENNLMTKDLFTNLVNKSIDRYKVYFDFEDNNLFNKMLTYSIYNHEVYSTVEISEENFVLYENKLKNNLITKEIFCNFLTDNMELYSDYFGGQNNDIFNKMLNYSIINNKIYELEELDDLVEEKILSYRNMKEVIDDFDRIMGRYTIYMEEPFGVDSNIMLVYYDINCNSVEVTEIYKSLIEISIIRTDLIDSYRELLAEENKYSINNLITMIIYYGDSDATMDLNDLPSPIDYRNKP